MFWFSKKDTEALKKNYTELLKAVEHLALCRTLDVITDRELPFPGHAFHSDDCDKAVDKVVGVLMRTDKKAAAALRDRMMAMPNGLTGLNYLAQQENAT